MLRFLAAAVTLAAIAASILAAWTPIQLAEAALRADLGPHEYIGWPGTARRLLYTGIVTAVVLVLVLWPLNRALARMKRTTLHRLELVGQCLALALMLWILLLPAFVWRALGVINAAWDGTPSRAETYRFITLVQHHRGREHADYVRADDPAQALALFTIRADPDREPGTLVTLYRHDGALGMPYISTRP
jgi:hypothetical protein